MAGCAPFLARKAVYERQVRRQAAHRSWLEKQDRVVLPLSGQIQRSRRIRPPKNNYITLRSRNEKEKGTSRKEL